MATHRIKHHSFHLFSHNIQNRQPIIDATINARETIANALLQQMNAGEIGVEKIFFVEHLICNFCPEHRRQ